MNVSEFIADLARRDIHLKTDGEQLNIRAPKGALTPEIRAQLSQHKAEVLAFLRRRDLGGPVEAQQPVIVPDVEGRHEPFPLTDMQQAYWLGRSGAFDLGQVTCQSYMEFEGEGLDLPRLERAWQRLVQRHDMMRAVVLPEGSQRILAEVPPYRVEVEDARHLAPEPREERLLALRQELSHRVTPTHQWPLFELRATRVTDSLTRMHLRIELMIADAWSISLLLRDWAKLYQAPEQELEPLTVSFRDYVRAETAFRETESFCHSQAYWRDRLATLPPAPDLPLARSPSALRKMEFSRRTAMLDAERWGRLKARATPAGVTASGALCAAFAEVLAAWSKSPRMSLNVTSFNRPPLHPGLDALVGDFASTLLLEVGGTRGTFTDRARRLQEQLGKDLEHGQYGGVRVLRDLGRHHGGAVTMPIVFTSTITSRTNTLFEIDWLGRLVYAISQTPQVWLDHQITEEKGALSFSWDTLDELFPPGLLDDLFSAYTRLLERLADDEAAWKEEYPRLLPESQLAQRAAVNATEAPVPPGLLHSPFLEQVARQPEHPAVIASGRTLTYAELHRRALALGHWLRARGAKPHTLVAVVMEKGWEQVVGVLGVLYAGAAYLPLDPELPAERLRYLLENGQASLALTQSWLEPRVQWPEGVRRYALDTAPEEPALAPLEPVPGAEELAYVIYTSGSTGHPKGVMIDHRGALNTVVDINQRFGVTAEDRVLGVSALTFDLSVYDIFGTLAAGATLVLPDAERARDPEHWSQRMREHRVTVWNSAPPLMEMLLEYAGGSGDRLAPTLRLALLSGDWIPVTLPGQLRARVPGVRLISLGGATEASIWSILYPIEDVDPEWKSIPYGKPMRNQSFHVLNEALEPCPVWVPGQLYIGGIGLAKGYWRDEVKTAASFITHPRTGQRLYRTGDLGRYLPDGDLEFLGREDFQVKVRGYRIELGEIETALSEHPAVRASVVVALGERRGHKRLVAYVVPRDGESPTVDALRDFLGQKLPDYMVPSTLMLLERLPLSSNGKVDRRALPAPEAQAAEARAHYEAPRSDTERVIAQAWQAVLGVAQVGIHDNFFDLGGDSVLMVQVLGRLRESMGAELSVVELFRYPTVSALAKARADMPARQASEQRQQQQSQARADARRDFLRQRSQRGR
ncbi:non-ribosomal peptide synthetase [Melittangium boletus]|uniref:non-ribosomal peptide synthetase n=1 Tax=Melittangium boletus TaxID=83453 RepID=UPI000BB3C318|nr:non-ribosomal peptide synthetase [Melittangium boletus]